MIVHIFEALPYNDPCEAFFVDLDQIGTSSPKDLQEYKKILEAAIAEGNDRIRAYSKWTFLNGYVDTEDCELPFALLPCVVNPPCMVDASISVDIFWCSCPCHQGNNKKNTHLASCQGRKCDE